MWTSRHTGPTPPFWRSLEHHGDGPVTWLPSSASCLVFQHLHLPVLADDVVCPHPRTNGCADAQRVGLPRPLAAAYTLAVLPNLVDILVLLGSDVPSPDIVVEMFSEREVILIGWLPLAFDLFVGRWWQRLVATSNSLRLVPRAVALDVRGAPWCPHRHGRHPRTRSGNNHRCMMRSPSPPAED